jgi:acylphosphatase
VNRAVIRRHVWISGQVQGVWFRQSCSERARLAQVAGWVRNRRDGRVEAVFEGHPEAVDTMVAWCWQGPARAVVMNVEVALEQPESLHGFRVAGSD